jgi:ABC-type glycerol-3-phosphate transport system substrate-binding protein
LKVTAGSVGIALLAACMPAAPPAEPETSSSLPDTEGRRVFAELESPPDSPPFEGGPTWVPQDLSGETLLLWGLQYDPHVGRYEELAATFEKRTGAEVEVQPQAWPVDQKVMTSMAAGSPPDVVCFMGVHSAPIIRQKGILPIDDLIFDPLGIDVDKWWRPGAIGAYFHDGQYYGVPVEDNWDGYNVAGRLDLIAEAGSGAEALWPGSKGEEGVWFESYEDLFQLAEMLQQQDDQGNVDIWGLNSKGWEMHSLLSIMRSLGTFWWDVENQQFHMDNDACVEAVRLLVVEPFDRGIEGILGTTQINAFVAGQVALARGNATTPGESWKVDIQGENVIAPPPVPGETPLFVGEGGWGFEMTSQARNKDAAIEFMKFMCTYEAQYIFSQIYGVSPPATWGLVGSDLYEGDHPIKVGIRRVLKALENCVFFGWGYGVTGTIGGVIGGTLDEVREGKLNAEEAAAQMQDGCVAQLDQWNSEA